MNKAKEISALYKDIKQQMGKLVSLCHEVEDHAEATEAHAEVTADAYQRGYETAKHECEDCPKQAYTDALKMESYQNGLSDAWEAARKIDHMADETIKEIFGCGFSSVFENLIASECIEKIRQYEQEKEEQITKGDIVLIKSTPEIEILATYADEEYVSGIALTEVDGNCEIGDQYTNIRISNVEKTGKHYDIASVLAKMKEANNG